MDRGIFVALSGAIAQERRMELLADNLANVNTAGFKKQKPVFEEAMLKPQGHRTFVVSGGAVTDMSQGANERTERPLDVAIKGDGFFVVKTPFGERYTRDGSFTVSPDGTLVTKDGNPVLGGKGPIKLGSPDVKIDSEGVITVNGIAVEKLKVVAFENPWALKREGGGYAATAQAGTDPMPPGATELQQGYVESSNVNAVRMMTTMIEATRSYETQAKMIQTLDDMTKKSIEEVGRG